MSDDEIELLAADFISEDWQPHYYYRNMSIVGFARSLLAAHEAKKQQPDHLSADCVACAATVPAPHDNNHPYVLRHVGCGHGVLFTDPCVECEIVSLQEQYRNAVRTVQIVRDRMRQLGRPMPGETSGWHKQ